VAGGSTRFLTGVLSLDSVNFFWIFVETVSWSGRSAEGEFSRPKILRRSEAGVDVCRKQNSVQWLVIKVWVSADLRHTRRLLGKGVLGVAVLAQGKVYLGQRPTVFLFA